MALQKQFTTDHGIDLSAAYFRVERPKLISKTRVDFEVCGYASAGAADTSAPVSLQGYSAPYVIAGENPIKQAYDHIKSLPEFSNAEDV